MSERRRQILDAALSIFVDKGYIGTTIADIRKASGATTGSIYHFFGSKPGIAVAVWRDAIADWTRLSEVDEAAQEPQQLIVASVRGLLKWATSNRPQFLFFEELRLRAYIDANLAPILEDINTTHLKASALYKAWAEAKKVRDLPWPVASALMVGPAYDYLRKSGDTQSHGEALELLPKEAWRAVRCK